MSHHVRVGLIGCGNIGASFAGLLAERRADVRGTTGIDLELTRIAVKNLGKPRPGIDPALLTDDTDSVVLADDIDVIVELIGGIDPVKDLLLEALKSGKPVVTANKELIAAHGEELSNAAAEAGVDLFFETAVVAGVPVLRSLRESLIGESISKITGIINGTSNFMLTRMADEGLDYDAVLQRAQELGLAEPDPTADVSGADVASKLAILASLAFKRLVRADDIEREGITEVKAEDFDIAARFGYTIKLLAVAEVFRDAETGQSEIGAQVFPALVGLTHPLAAVRDSFNAVSLSCDAAGELLFHGPGAGQLPSSSAVLGDLIAAADHLRRDTHRRVPFGQRAVLRDPDRLVHSFYLRLRIVDVPGTLSEVSGVLGAHGVSIRTITQQGRGDDASVVFITHPASEGSLRAAIAEFSALSSVHGDVSLMRIVE
jgi:homoserine dehydrogenase